MYPYIVYGTITNSSGSVVNGAVVWLRNETTNEKIYDTTGSDGKYTLDAMNLASGYLTTDTFTVYCNASNEYKEASYLFSSNTHTVNLTLATIEDSELIYYATVTDVLEELGDKTTSDISAHRVVKAIQRAESEIEEQTSSAWRSVTVTNEIYDWNFDTSYKSNEQLNTINSITRTDYWNIAYNDTIKLNHSPIVSITTLSRNSAGENAADTWTALTEQTGSSGDFIKYSDEGLVKFMTNIPRFGKRSIRITYIYGHTTVPMVVNRLTILLAIKGIMGSKYADSEFGSQKTISVDGLTVQASGFSGGGGSYMNMLNKEIQECWDRVGNFKSVVV
jgi:hypothetical protein